MNGYKMTGRPFSIGAQPEGSVKVTDEANSLMERKKRGYYCIVWYERELSSEEMQRFELRHL